MQNKCVYPWFINIREQTTEQCINLLEVKIDFYPLNHTCVIDSWGWKKLESLPVQSLEIFASFILPYKTENSLPSETAYSFFWTEQIIRKFIPNLSFFGFRSFKLLNYFHSLELHMTFSPPIYLPPWSWLPCPDNPQFLFPSRSFPSNWCTLNIVSAKTPARARP